MFRIMIDMDGVVADFVRGSLQLYGRDNPYDDPSHHGHFNFIELLQPSMTENEFWSKIDTEFWSSLPPTTECFELVDFLIDLVGEEHLCFLTKPGGAKGASVNGKLDWLGRYFPNLSSQVLLAVDNSKDFCAAPGKILIDDNDRNVEGFSRSGGHGILFPRLWNKDHMIAGRGLEVVKERVLSLVD